MNATTQILGIIALPLVAVVAVVGAAIAIEYSMGARANPLVRSWWGEPERHAAAARKGWANRRRGYPASWDTV